MSDYVYCHVVKDKEQDCPKDSLSVKVRFDIDSGNQSTHKDDYYSFFNLNNPTQMARRYQHLEEYGIRDLWDVITLSGEVGISKPNPEIFLLTAKRLDIEPFESVVIEDGINGMIAAKKAGVLTQKFVDRKVYDSPADSFNRYYLCNNYYFFILLR